MSEAAPTPEMLTMPAEDKAMVDRYLAEISSLNEQMELDRSEIDRLKAETAALKAETRRLRVEAQAALERLEAVV